MTGYTGFTRFFLPSAVADERLNKQSAISQTQSGQAVIDE
jgi:hypothetical protein